jgi:Yip1 domain
LNCPKCGQSVSTDTRFCGQCGSHGGSRPHVRDFGLAAASLSGGGTTSGFATSTLLPGLLDRIKNIVLAPKVEWRVIEAEPTTVSKLYSGYVMPMAAFAAVMSFFRLSIVGVNVPFGGTIRTSLLSGLSSSLLTFVLGLIGLYLVGLVINVLARGFGAQPDRRQALKTAAYALTPAWLGTALTFLPLGNLLQLLAGLYGIYVLYLGLPLMMRGKPVIAGGYTAAVVACTIGIGLLFGIGVATLGAAAGPH